MTRSRPRAGAGGNGRGASGLPPRRPGRAPTPAPATPADDGRAGQARHGSDAARAHDDDGKPTYRPERRRKMVDVAGFRTFRQAYWGGTFEATTIVGLGVRARVPFRVFTLNGPGDHRRLVVDVAHRR